MRPHAVHGRCAVACATTGAERLPGALTTAASADGSGAFAGATAATALAPAAARRPEPHILQKFMPGGLGVLHAGQATADDDSTGARGRLGAAELSGGTVVAPASPGAGDGAGFLARRVRCGSAPGRGPTGARDSTAGRGPTGARDSTTGRGAAGAAGLTGAAAMMVFCGGRAGVSGNRAGSALGPRSGAAATRRAPQL
jgi:hypothetical protein